MKTQIHADVVHAFVSSLIHIYQAVTGQEGVLEPLALTTELPPPPGVVVNIQVQGHLCGPAIWSFAPGVTQEIAAKMLGGDVPPPSYDSPEARDAVAELANIVVGNATDSLLQAGYPVELSPPTTELAAPEVKLAEQTWTVSLMTSKGLVSLHLAFRQE